MINYQQILQEIFLDIKDLPNEGKVASYIPELSKIDAHKFGIHICNLKGASYHVGDSEERFSIQSISKVFMASLAFSKLGDSIWQRVGVEPSGTRFNSLIQLELENGIPRNPFINAGALVVADMLITHLKHPKNEYLEYIQKLAGENSINYDFAVADSEKDYGYRNAALVNFMKSYGNIENDIDDVLDFYFHACSIEMSCRELAQSFLLYANQGIVPGTGEQLLDKSQTKRMNALMQTCGFYDEAGEFSFKVGLPGKSGVGGGIAAVFPREYAVAVWSPKLNKKGNSVLGLKTLEQLTTKSGLSIF